MSEMFRTFVAVTIAPLPKLQATLRALEAVGGPIKVVGTDKLHVTLKFLGDTPSERMAEIRQHIAAIAARQSRFRLTVERIGAFPHVQRPSVIWAGCFPAEPLVSLASQLEDAMEPLGFPREQRPFQPHLTLARVKGRPPAALFDLLRHEATTSFGTAEIGSIEFLRSELHPSGARYTTLSEHALAKGS